MEITREVNNILVEAYEVAKKNNHEFVTAEHILYAITFQERFITVIEELEGNVEQLRSKLLDYLNSYMERDESGKVQESYNFQQIILRASEQAIYASSKDISMEHMISAIYELDNSYAQYYLLEEGIEKRELLYRLCHDNLENTYYIDDEEIQDDDIDEEEADKSAYFIQQGIIYPTVKNDESMFLMPKVVQKIIKDKNDIDYRRILKGNTELINIYRGMNKAYGILKVEDAVKMLERFNTAIKEIEKENNIVIKNEDIDKIITIASMIEKEASEDIDRPLISSVIYNRLEKGMKLQLDATVLYAYGYHKDKLYYKDLEIESPYNTYLYKGLPIGPISNPGAPSIIAALKPENTDYLFYVLESDNKHYFTNNDEDFMKKQEELGY